MPPFCTYLSSGGGLSLVPIFLLRNRRLPKGDGRDCVFSFTAVFCGAWRIVGAQ